MYAAEVDQDLSCRTLGRCVYGHAIDRELGNMIPDTDPIPPKAFRYARYNAELTERGLDDLKLGELKPKLDELLKMDLATQENIKRLRVVGDAVGNEVRSEHFGDFLDA